MQSHSSHVSREQYALDLAALIKALLRAAFILIFTTLLGGAAGYGLSYLQTPKWRVSAQFDAPTVAELGNYYALLSTYNLLNGGEPISYKLIKDEKGTFVLAPESNNQSSAQAVERSYAEFKRQLTSTDTLHAYLNGNELIKRKAIATNQSEVVLMQKVAAQFQFQAASRSVAQDSISYLGDNAAEGAQLISGFLHFANLRARESLNNELITRWKVLFQQIKQAAEGNLGVIQQGSEIARQDWQGKLAMMRAVQPLDNQLQAYRLTHSPSTPLAPSSPNRPVWATIGALSGLLLALFGLTLVRLSRQKNLRNPHNQYEQN